MHISCAEKNASRIFFETDFFYVHKEHKIERWNLLPPWVERHVHKHSVVSVRLLLFGSTVRCLVALGISFYTNETRNWKVDECSVCSMCKFSNLKSTRKIEKCAISTYWFWLCKFFFNYFNLLGKQQCGFPKCVVFSNLIHSKLELKLSGKKYKRR